MFLIFIFFKEIFTCYEEISESDKIKLFNVHDTEMSNNTKTHTYIHQNKKRKRDAQEDNENNKKTKKPANYFDNTDFSSNVAYDISLNKNNHIETQSKNQKDLENADYIKNQVYNEFMDLNLETVSEINKIFINSQDTFKGSEDGLLKQDEHSKSFIQDQINILKQCWISEFKIYDLLIECEYKSIDFFEKQINCLTKSKYNDIKRQNSLYCFKKCILQKFSNDLETEEIQKQYDNNITSRNQEMKKILEKYEFHKTIRANKIKTYMIESNQKKTILIDTLDVFWKKEIERQKILLEYEKKRKHTFLIQCCNLKKQVLNPINSYETLLIEKIRKIENSQKQIKFLEEYREAVFLEYNSLEENKTYENVINDFKYEDLDDEVLSGDKLEKINFITTIKKDIRNINQAQPKISNAKNSEICLKSNSSNQISKKNNDFLKDEPKNSDITITFRTKKNYILLDKTKDKFLRELGLIKNNLIVENQINKEGTHTKDLDSTHIKRTKKNRDKGNKFMINKNDSFCSKNKNDDNAKNILEFEKSKDHKKSNTELDKIQQKSIEQTINKCRIALKNDSFCSKNKNDDNAKSISEFEKSKDHKKSDTELDNIQQKSIEKTINKCRIALKNDSFCSKNKNDDNAKNILKFEKSKYHKKNDTELDKTQQKTIEQTINKCRIALSYNESFQKKLNKQIKFLKN